MKIVPNHLQEIWFLMLFMQKERNMSEYIDFIAYQDDAIYQCPLRYYRKRGQPHPQPKGDLHQGNRHWENGTHHDDYLLWTCAGRLFWWHPMPADDGRFIQIKADLSKMIKKHVLARNADFECLQRLNTLNLQPLKMGVCKDIWYIKWMKSSETKWKYENRK